MSGDNLTFHILYPDNRVVSAEKIIGWFEDAVANCEIDGVETVKHDVHPAYAAELLDRAGLITLARSR